MALIVDYFTCITRQHIFTSTCERWVCSKNHEISALIFFLTMRMKIDTQNKKDRQWAHYLQSHENIEPTEPRNMNTPVINLLRVVMNCLKKLEIE